MASTAAANAVLEDFTGSCELNDYKLTSATTTVLVNRVGVGVEVTCKIDPDGINGEETDAKWKYEETGRRLTIELPREENTTMPIDFHWRNNQGSGRLEASLPREYEVEGCSKKIASSSESSDTHNIGRMESFRSDLTDSCSNDVVSVNPAAAELLVRERNRTEGLDMEADNPADLSMTSSSSSFEATKRYHSRHDAESDEDSFQNGVDGVDGHFITTEDDQMTGTPDGRLQPVKIISTGPRIVPDAYRRFHPPNKRRKLEVGCGDIRAHSEDIDSDEDNKDSVDLKDRWNDADVKFHNRHRLLTHQMADHVTSSHHNKSSCFSIADILRPEFGSALSAGSSPEPSINTSLSSPSSIAEDLTSPSNRFLSSTPVSDASAPVLPPTRTSGHKIALADNRRAHQRKHSSQPCYAIQLPSPPPSKVIASVKSGNDVPEDYFRFHQQQGRTHQQQQQIEYQLQHQMQQQQHAAIRRHQHSNLVAATTAAALLQQHHHVQRHPVVNPYAAFYAAAIAAAAAAAQQVTGNTHVETGSSVPGTAPVRGQITRSPFVRVPVPLGGCVMPQQVSTGKPSPIISNALSAVLRNGGGNGGPETLADRFTNSGLARIITNNNNNNKEDDVADIKAKFDCCNEISLDSKHHGANDRLHGKPHNSSTAIRRVPKTSPRQLPLTTQRTAGVALTPPSFHRLQPHNKVSPAHLRRSVTSSGGDDIHDKQQMMCTAGGSETNQSSSRSTTSSVDLSRSEDTGVRQGSTPDKQGVAALPWPAWVYCTRYSDRPSSGPRSRKPKKKETLVALSDEKRPRTAFTASQLERLKREFDSSKYLSEERRQSLANELSLNESQIKIWFQNKRAKMKKASGVRNQLALQLMAQGLYNHSSSSSSSSTSTSGGVMMPGPASVTVGPSSHGGRC